MPTIYDLSRQLGLGVSTISKALNGYSDVSEKTRQRVLEAAREMGFQPNSNAQALKTKRSRLIGVLHQDIQGGGLMHPHFGTILEYFRRSVEEHGYELMLMNQNTGRRRRSFVEQCRYRNFEGMLIMVAEQNDPDVQQLIAGEVPKVLVDAECPGQCSVLSDNVQGGIQAVEYLYAMGHRRIAHLAAPLKTLAGDERMAGYREGLTRVGLKFEPELTIEAPGYRVNDGRTAMSALLRRSGAFSAVFTGSDSLAFGAMDVLRQRGILVPEQISIVGFDNLDSNMMSLWPLTTIAQNREQIGRMAADMLFKQISGQSPEVKNLRLPVQLVERTSCTPLKHNY